MLNERKYSREFLEKNSKLINFYFITAAVIMVLVPMFFGIAAAFGLFN